MLWISFAQWGSSAGCVLKMRRIYVNGHRWTPFVWVTPRYMGA